MKKIFSILSGIGCERKGNGIIKGFITATAAITLFAASAGAAEAAAIESVAAGVEPEAPRTVHVTVRYDSPEAAQESTLLVVKKGADIVSRDGSVFRYMDQKKVDGSTAVYSFVMAASDRTGTYDAYIGGTKIDAPATAEISFDLGAATTIEFTSGGTSIADSVLVNTAVGGVITITDYAPERIEYEGKFYTRDKSNNAAYTAENAINTLAVTYSLDEIVSNENICATVIGSNLPILPTTFTATTASGAVTTVTDAAWDLSKLTEGENTVTGTAYYGTANKASANVTATVTVLPESFALEDAASKGTDNNNIQFPRNIADEFYIEFDMVINAVSDTGANFGYNGSCWSSGAFGISPNGGSLKATGGNKSGTSDGGTVLKSEVKAGETYRILVKADASTDTFTVYATGSDGSVGIAENKTFRTAHDYINTINLRGNNAADNDLEIKNIRVYAPGTVTATFTDSADSKAVMTVTGRTGFTVEARDIFVLSEDGTGVFYTIPKTIVTEDCTVPVSTAANKYAVTGDSFVNNSNTTDERGTRLMAAAADGTEGVEYAPSVNADGETTSHGGAYFASARAAVLEFGISEAMRGKAVLMKVYVDGYQSNYSTDNKCTLAAYTINNQADAESLSILYDDAALNPTSGPIFAIEGISGGGDYNINKIDRYVTFDVTEAVHAALDSVLDKITFKILTPHGGVYLADRNACTVGGALDGKAAYLTLEDAKTVNVSGAERITKNGSLINSESVKVSKSSVIRLTGGTLIAAFADESSRLYKAEGGAITLAGAELTADLSLTAYELGIKISEGAQVRIGQGVKDYNNLGYKINDTETSLDPKMASSGIRFIGLIDTAVIGLAGSRENIDKNAEVGIKITAEGGGSVKIPAVHFQDQDKTVFTAALVNLHESNYNRIFTAVPYVTVNGVTFEGGGVSRSIYEVAAGVLAESRLEVTNPAVSAEVNETLYRVLNAYINQVGIRLNFASDIFSARTAGSGKYQGAKSTATEAFFVIDSYEDLGNAYKVNISIPQGSNAEIFGYWQEYVRLNNVKIAKDITNSSLSADGKTLELTIKRTLDASEGDNIGVGDKFDDVDAPDSDEGLFGYLNP